METYTLVQIQGSQIKYVQKTCVAHHKNQSGVNPLVPPLRESHQHARTHAWLYMVNATVEEQTDGHPPQRGWEKRNLKKRQKQEDALLLLYQLTRPHAAQGIPSASTCQRQQRNGTGNDDNNAPHPSATEHTVWQ